MASTNDILARLAQWALTSRDFTADLAALGEFLAAKDRAI